MHGFDFGAVLFDRNGLQDDPVLLLLVPGARLHGIQLATVDDNTVLRHVSDLLQGFLEGF